MTVCPTCGSQTSTTTVDDQGEEEVAPAETVSELMNRRIRQRSYPAADRYASLMPRPPDEAA